MIDVKFHWTSIAFYIIQTCEHKFQLCPNFDTKWYIILPFFFFKLSRNYELRSRTKNKQKNLLFFLSFFLQNVDKICYGQHVICTDGRVTGNKTLFLFGLIILFWQHLYAMYFHPCMPRLPIQIQSLCVSL